MGLILMGATLKLLAKSPGVSWLLPLSSYTLTNEFPVICYVIVFMFFVLVLVSFKPPSLTAAVRRW